MTMSDYSGAEPPLIPGTLRGYRSWNITGLVSTCPCGCGERMASEAGATLLPVTYHTFAWVDGINVAVCGNGGPHQIPYVSPFGPEMECRCGFYAKYRPEFIEGVIRGVIEASGRIVLGTKGLRAEKARIIAAAPNDQWIFITSRDDVVDQLQKKYSSTKWFDTTATMLEEYPPQSVDELLGQDMAALIREREELEKKERFLVALRNDLSLKVALAMKGNSEVLAWMGQTFQRMNHEEVIAKLIDILGEPENEESKPI